MGNKVNLLKEVYNRLYQATQNDGDLVDIKGVFMGTREEARAMADFPIINIQWSGGREEPAYQNKASVDEMRIEITLIDNKLASQTNILFDYDLEEGPIYLFEKMLNVLDKNIAGGVDLNFNANANNLRGFEYNVEYLDEIIEISTVTTVQTSAFFIGGR